MASTEATAADPAGRPAHAAGLPAAEVSRRTWLATVVLLVTAFMELMDVTMANVALPSIQQDLGASYEQVQWVVAGYALAFAVALMSGGRLGDIWGRKKAFLTGLVGFLVFSLLCGVAPNPGFLITSRVLQGLSAAVMLPQVLSSIAVWFPPEKRAAAFGLFGAVSGIGGLVAPLIGGALINADLFSLDWRPVFLINLPIGAITLVAAALLVDDSKSPMALRLDPLGVLVSAGAVFLVVFPVIQGRDAGWPAWVWIMLALAVPVLAIFVLLERWKARRDGSPVVDLALFRLRGFPAGLLVTVAFFAGVTAIAFVFMIFLQSGFGYTPFRAGLSLVPLAFGLVIGSGLSINMSKRIGRTVLQVGSIVALGGSLWLSSVVGGHESTLGFWNTVGPMAVLGLGIGMVVAPLNDTVLAGIPPQSTGSASGLQSTMIQIGNAVGVAVLGVIFFGFIANRADSASANVTPALQRNLVAHGVPADAARAVATGMATCFHDRTHATDPTSTPPSCVTPSGLPSDLQNTIQADVTKAATAATRKDFSGSMQRTLYWEAGVFGLTALLVFLVPGVKRDAAASHGH